MSQTPNIAVETFSYGDNTGPETTETGEPSSQKDTPEDRAEQLWSHALELLQEKLSDQEAAAWSAAIRSNMPRVRQYSVAMAKDSFDRAYRPKPGCVVDAVDEMIAHLRLVMVEPDLEDGGDEEEEEDQETEEVKEEEEEGEDEDQGEGQNGAESDENKAGTGMPSKAQKEKKMRSHDQLMAKVLQTYPYAAIVWAVSLATLKSLSKPASGYDEVVSAYLISVIGRTEWYASLYKLVFQPDQPEPESSLRDSIKALGALYETILLFHAQAVTKAVRQEPGRWEVVRGEADEIEVCLDIFVRSFDRLLFSAQITGHSRAAEDGKLHDVLAKLQTAKQKRVATGHEPTGKSDVSQKMLELALNEPACADFFQWSLEQKEPKEHNERILWICASPGTGRFTLLRSIVQKVISDSSKFTLNANTAAPTAVVPARQNIAFFFYHHHLELQSGEVHDDFALDAVKGLIYDVISSQPHLSSHLEHMFSDDFAALECNKRDDFDAPGDFAGMASLLCRIVQDDRFEHTYFVLDGIDSELDSDLDPQGSQVLQEDDSSLIRLLGLVAATTELSSRVRWILSADSSQWSTCTSIMNSHEPDMRYRQLDLNKDLDPDEVFKILRIYAVEGIDHRSSHMAGKYNNKHIRKKLLETVDSIETTNFLWMEIALSRALGPSTAPWNAAATLDKLTKQDFTVDRLYAKALGDALSSSSTTLSLEGNHAKYCESVLMIAATAYQRLRVSELASLGDLPPDVDLRVLIQLCLPTFLSVSEDDDIVHFTHHSARSYVRERRFVLEPAPKLTAHALIARRCLGLLLKRLRCSCDQPVSLHIGESPYTDDGNEKIAYSLYMWSKHMTEPGGRDDREAFALVTHLLSTHLEGWLELLGPKRNSILRCLNMLRRLHAAVVSCDRTKHSGVEQSRQDDFVGNDQTAQVLQEAIIVLQKHQRVSMLLVEQDGDTAKKGMQSELANWLLTAAKLPNLRRSIVSGQFPWLETLPNIDISDASTSLLHNIDHGDWVRGCCFSPDGRLVASASDDGCVRLWDARTGNIQQSFEGFDEGEYVRGVTMFSRATGLQNQKKSRAVGVMAFTSSSVRAWDVFSGKPTLVLDKLEGNVQGVALSPDAQKLAIANMAGLFVLEKPLDGPVGGRYSTGDTDCVAFSPCGRWMASAELSVIRIWDAKASADKEPKDDAKELFRLPMRHKNSAAESQVDASEPNGDIPREEMQALQEPNEEVDAEEQRAGEEGSDDDDDSSSSREDEDELAMGHDGCIQALAFSPDSKFLVSCSDDRTARVWDLSTYKTTAILEYHASSVTSVAFSSDGTYIATGSRDNDIAIWKNRSPGDWGDPETPMRPDRVLSGHSSDVLTVAFAPSPFPENGLYSASSMLVSSSIDHHLRIWDIATEVIDTLDKTDEKEEDRMLLHGHRSRVTFVATTQNCDLIATASEDGMICFWDGTTAKQLCQVDQGKYHQHELLVLAFSPDDVLLLTCDMRGGFFVWNTEMPAIKTLPSSRSPVPRLNFDHGDWTRDAVFHPNGKLVATACDDGKVRIFDVSKAREPPAPGGADENPLAVAPFKTFDPQIPYMYVYSVAFSPDGSRVASGSDDLGLRIWNLDCNEDSAVINDPEYVGFGNASIMGISYSNDDRKIASVSSSGLITVWTWEEDSREEEQGETAVCPPKPGSLKALIVKKMPKWYETSFRRIRFDPQYPGLIFTEHGPRCIDVNVEAMAEGAMDDDDSDSEDEVEASSQWIVPRVGVYGKSIMWMDHQIKLPEAIEITEEPYSWRVQGRMIVAGCENGHVLIFRFLEDASPQLR